MIGLTYFYDSKVWYTTELNIPEGADIFIPGPLVDTFMTKWAKYVELFTPVELIDTETYAINYAGDSSEPSAKVVDMLYRNKISLATPTENQQVALSYAGVVTSDVSLPSGVTITINNESLVVDGIVVADLAEIAARREKVAKIRGCTFRLKSDNYNIRLAALKLILLLLNSKKVVKELLKDSPSLTLWENLYYYLNVFYTRITPADCNLRRVSIFSHTEGFVELDRFKEIISNKINGLLSTGVNRGPIPSSTLGLASDVMMNYIKSISWSKLICVDPAYSLEKGKEYLPSKIEDSLATIDLDGKSFKVSLNRFKKI